MSQPANSSEPSTTPIAPAPASPLPTSPFAPMDAEVLEEAQVAGQVSYPYGASAVPFAAPARPPWEANYPIPFQSHYPFRPPLPKEKVYSVPKRFGLSALLALITALACLFGGLRTLDTPPVIYLFLGTEVMAICVAQMFYNAEPRRASMIAGAILMPIFLAGTAFFVPGSDLGATLCMIIPGILFGAFAGYLIGTCVAGLFLLMDKLEPYLPGGKKESI
ncbi:MAG: hypothetical protein ACKVP0_08935 [Pirellulaceae bacterium]